MKKGGGSESTIIIGPSKSVLVYALHSLEKDWLGLLRYAGVAPTIASSYVGVNGPSEAINITFGNYIYG